MYPPNDNQIPQRLSEQSQYRRAKKAKRQGAQFLRGPVPLAWLYRAAKLPGKALAVSLAVHYKAGVENTREPIAVTAKLLERFGVSRKAGYRGLEALERTGLVSVDRRRGRCPRVTISEIKR